MLNEFKKEEIFFNDQYDELLIQSPYYAVLVSHINNLYPLVYKGLSYHSLLEQYVEPKIIKLFELEIEYREQGYPLSGCTELAYKDVYAIIKDELEEEEKNENLQQFDLDINPIIDTEEIASK